MVRASIIVPAYNASKHLGQCLDSLISQTEPSLEIIIIDDGSTDATLKIAESYSLRDSRVRVIHQTNRGVSAARNLGLEEAIGIYVCFVDADDWCDPKMISEMSLRMESTNSQFLVAGVQYEFFDSADEFIASKIVVPPNCLIDQGSGPNLKDVSLDFLNLIGYSSNKIYRREWLIRQQICFTDGLNLSEDLEFNMHALCGAQRVAFMESSFLHYRNSSGSSLSNIRGLDFLELRLRAIGNVDRILERLSASPTIRREWSGRLSCSALGAAVSASAMQKRSTKHLRMVLRTSATDELLKLAYQHRLVDFRTWWVRFTVRYGFLRLAVAPFQLKNKISSGRSWMGNIRRPV